MTPQDFYRTLEEDGFPYHRNKKNNLTPTLNY